MEKKTLSRQSLELLVRRMDGRFLSSNPYPKKSICFAKGSLSDAVDLISESVIHSDTIASDCELAVAVDPDDKTLEAAWSALRSDGTCYIEWNVTRLVNLKTIRGKLEASGFDNILFYVPKPPPDISRSKAWIPLESKKAIEFWGSKEFSYAPHKNNKRTNLFLRRCFVKMFSGLFKSYPGLLYPRFKRFTICSIARKPITPTNKLITRDNTPISHNQTDFEHESTESNSSILDKPGAYCNSQHFSILMETGGRTAINKVILNIFTNNKNEPSSIVKMRRLAQSTKRMNNEANTLKHLETNFKDINIAPKLLFSENVNGHSYMAETYINGKTLNRILTNNNFSKYSMKATELLVELDTVTRKKVPHDWKDKLIKPIVTKFITSYETVLEPDLIKTTAKLLNEIELTHTVCTHGDYGDWNIVIKPDGKLALIDWEHSIIQGFPVIDLTFFFTHSVFKLKAARNDYKHVTYYRDLMNETTDIGSVYKECVNYYCDRVRIPKSSVPIFQLLLWVITLNHRYHTFTILENVTPKNESLQKFSELELALWKEEITRFNY